MVEKSDKHPPGLMIKVHITGVGGQVLPDVMGGEEHRFTSMVLLQDGAWEKNKTAGSEGQPTARNFQDPVVDKGR